MIFHLIAIPFLLLNFAFLFNFTPYTFASNVDIGVSISNGKIRSFYFSLSDYYRIPEEKIIIIKRKYPVIIDDELPVILLIIREARVDPDIIIELRKRGYSWYDIMIRFGIYPEVIFRGYLDYGPPYGKAWGHYKKPKKIKFKDTDIIILSNIKFLSEYYHESPEIIIKYKEKHPKFIDVHEEIYKQKRGKKEKIDNHDLHKFNGKFHDKNWEREQNFLQERPGRGRDRTDWEPHERKGGDKKKRDQSDLPPGWNKKHN